MPGSVATSPEHAKYHRQECCLFHWRRNTECCVKLAMCLLKVGFEMSTRKRDTLGQPQVPNLTYSTSSLFFLSFIYVRLRLNNLLHKTQSESKLRDRRSIVLILRVHTPVRAWYGLLMLSWLQITTFTVSWLLQAALNSKVLHSLSLF